ncbi:MAG: 3-oxoacyl-ACP reductase FabG [Desulfuromonas sp.]|nr:MAG: 3-oxoacyl-ACP reductase FabG [Desulfuromonas sp.]
MTEQKKVALVTGASKGIGAVIARELAADGFHIWLNYRSDHESARQVADQIAAAGGSCELLPFDVADAGATEAALEPLLAEQVPFALVNNAGFARDGIMAMMSQEDWEKVLAVHLNGFFNVTRLVVARMLKKRQGRIINIVSTSGESGVAGQVNYSAAKAGLIGATRSLAAEVGRRNILVNAVSPGFITTDMTSELPMEKILPMIPLGRFGEAEEVSGIVGFLCSDRATYITGQVFAVNGGVHI